MVADIERLESAARLAMGSFEGAAAAPEHVPPQRRILLRAIRLLAVLAAAAVLAAQLWQTLNTI